MKAASPSGRRGTRTRSCGASRQVCHGPRGAYCGRCSDARVVLKCCGTAAGAHKSAERLIWEGPAGQGRCEAQRTLRLGKVGEAVEPGIVLSSRRRVSEVSMGGRWETRARRRETHIDDQEAARAALLRAKCWSAPLKCGTRGQVSFGRRGRQDREGGRRNTDGKAEQSDV